MNVTQTHASTGWRRLIARAVARSLKTFVVPDARTARDAGLDLASAGLELVATPRHASLLLIIGDLPPGLVDAATIVYAQMPRPRAVLALGAEPVAPLPDADVTASLDQAGLESGIARIRQHLTSHAWSLPTDPFTAPVLADATLEEDAGMDHSHHMHMHGAHGAMGHSAMGHSAMDHSAMDHGTMDHSAMDHGTMDHSAIDHGTMDHSAMDHGTMDHGTMDHGTMDHGTMDHGTMDHGAMDHGTMDHSAMDHSGHDHHHMHPAAPDEQASHDHMDHGGHPHHAAPPADEHASHDHMDHSAMGHGTMDRSTISHGEDDHPAAPAPDEHTGHDHMDHGGATHNEHADMSRGAHAHMAHDVAGHSSPVGMSHGGQDRTDHSTKDHGAMDHSGHHPAASPLDEHTGHDHMDHGAMDHSGHDHHHMHRAAPDEQAGHDHMDHSTMDHGAMGHDHHMMDGGFMSMVAMTAHLPRSLDGLPMEWMDTSFGPLFPGLPGGLAPTLTLDGDTVVSASLASGVMHRGVLASLPGPAATFPDRLAMLDPQAPVAYRTLAVKALAAVASPTPAPDDAGWIAACERERATSHLGWLAGFGELLGMRWLSTGASGLHLALVRAPDAASVTKVQARIERLLREIDRALPLKLRLAGIGLLDETMVAGASGPVARGSGIATDERIGNAAYADSDFRPIVRDDGDAFARLQVRTAEIRQSLRIVSAAGNVTAPAIHVSPHLTGSGMAAIETPRGAASLHIEVHHGHVHLAHVTVPSSQHARLVQHVVEQAELADALVGIASLDLSPWEMDQ